MEPLFATNRPGAYFRAFSAARRRRQAFELGQDLRPAFGLLGEAGSSGAQVHVSGQAGEVLRLRRLASQPSLAKPASVIAQVEGSGTAFKSSMSIEPSPLCTPAVTVALAEATRGVFAAAAAAGQPSPAPACGVGAGAVGAAIGKFRAESGATTRAVAPVPGGAGGDTRAANLRSA